MRELAQQLKVNPNTVVKAYQALAKEGVVEMRRGEGTFVAANPPQIPARERQRKLADAAARYAALASSLGVNEAEAIDFVQRALRRTGVHFEEKA